MVNCRWKSVNMKNLQGGYNRIDDILFLMESNIGLQLPQNCKVSIINKERIQCWGHTQKLSYGKKLLHPKTPLYIIKYVGWSVFSIKMGIRDFTMTSSQVMGLHKMKWIVTVWETYWEMCCKISGKGKHQWLKEEYRQGPKVQTVRLDVVTFFSLSLVCRSFQPSLVLLPDTKH